jgi:hypothetical protein
MAMHDMSQRIDEYRSCARTYVTLAIRSEVKNPGKVTSALGIAPTREHHPSPDANEVYGWFLSSKDLVGSKDFRRHIDHLIELLCNKNEVLQSLRAEGWSTDLECFWESATGNGGPMLDAGLMAKLAELQLNLLFDIWFDE